jgi:predicted Zn-dependent protease
LQASAKMGDRYTKLNPAEASEIRGNLARSVALMPDFGPAQQLFGFFETVQGERLAEAGPYLQRAIQLEPENLAYQLSFAQFQFRSRNPAGARQTLQPLLRLGVDVKLRSDAEELLQQINRLYPAGK